MGAEQSTLSAAEAEEQGKRFDEEIDKHAQEAKQNILRERREKQDAEQAHFDKNSPATVAEREPGVVIDEPAPEQIAVPIRSANSSQSTPVVNDVLAEWHPRKEKVAKKPIDKQRTEDGLVGFGNEPSLQGDNSKPAKQSLKQPLKQPPRLDTGSDTITISRKGTSANPVKSPTSAKTASAISATIPMKRPAAENHTNDARRPSFSALSSLPKIQKRTNVASPQSPERVEGGQPSSRPPKWYKDMPFPTSRNKNDSNVDILLQSLRTQMEKPKKENMRETELQQVFAEVRNKLHSIIFQQVNEQVLRRNRTLDNANGLPRIFDPAFDNGIKWPYDVQADAQELYIKWCRKVFETDIMRGIKTVNSVKGSKNDGGASIDRSYEGTVSSNYYGAGDLTNGQWWPFQICALRDGAHGVIQGGIYGENGKGAYSCILSGGVDSSGKRYPDEDDGDYLWYCGTDSDNGTPTAYTQRMLESADNGKSIRLIRSHNAHSDYAPEFGFRYDGLYRVAGFKRVDPEKSIRQRHIFKLMREPGQDPIRGGVGPQKRPTAQEIEEYRKHQRLSGRGNENG